MAQRNSRKGGSKTKKRPEMRTGGGRQAKAARSEERQRHAENTAAGGAPLVRMRPAGVGGAIALFGMGWLGTAAVAFVAHRLDRWGILSYPDSLWLYVCFGVLAVAAAVGRMSRTSNDADSWGAQALLVPAAILAIEAITGPGCPTGGDCAAIGARGALGLPLSFVVVIAFAAASWGLARWQQRSASALRPAHARVRLSAMLLTMLALYLFPGAVIAASAIGLDLWVRDTPKMVADSMDEVERTCFGLVDAPALAVRPAPNGYNPLWTTFAVRRANESRPGIGKKDLPKNWATLDYVHPYEATIAFDGNGEAVSVSCRKIGPGTGNATADDLKQSEPESNPLDPKTGSGSQFYPDLFKNPSAVASQIAEQAKTKAKKKK